MPTHILDNKTGRCLRCGAAHPITRACIAKFVARFAGGPYDGQQMTLAAAFEQVVLAPPVAPGQNVRYALVPTPPGSELLYTYVGLEPLPAPPPPLPERPF